MDRMVTAMIGGKERPLNYSIEVMFNVADKFGTISKALDVIGGKDGREGFEAVRWFAVQMANDAELCRREAGYDHEQMLQEKDISIRMGPLAYEELKEAVVEAISRGYHRETKGSDETDLGLAELEAKKAEAGKYEQTITLQP